MTKRVPSSTFESAKIEQTRTANFTAGDEFHAINHWRKKRESSFHADAACDFAHGLLIAEFNDVLNFGINQLLAGRKQAGAAFFKFGVQLLRDFVDFLRVFFNVFDAANSPCGAADRLRLAAATDVPGLGVLVETIAISVAEGRWSRVKLCASPDCRWAFYDTSRSGGGRWCSMEVCGNRHKTRAYRQRRATGPDSAVV